MSGEQKPKTLSEIVTDKFTDPEFYQKEELITKLAQALEAAEEAFIGIKDAIDSRVGELKMDENTLVLIGQIRVTTYKKAKAIQQLKDSLGGEGDK